jgi:phosphopantothenoylcysteine decarboxylase/phosphopantothenoylcysteine decarboxylase/phosphopantothenate--cysteine ligase
MTENAGKLICAATFQELTTKTGFIRSCLTEGYDTDVGHISLAKKDDLCLIAPATANFIGKLANGIADDMSDDRNDGGPRRPVIICPAMNTNMYENPVFQENFGRLKRYGYRFIEPKEGFSPAAISEKGRLPTSAILWKP